MSVLDRPIRDEAAAISADIAPIGNLAEDILDAQDWAGTIPVG